MLAWLPLFQTPTAVPPMGLDIAGGVAALNLLGILPVITLGAVMFVAAMVYKRFRK